MPRVCADDCAFVVDAGALGLNWEVVGSTFATAQSGLLQFTPDKVIDQSMFAKIRLAYTNNTCRSRILRSDSHIPRVNFNIGKNNWWNAMLFAAISDTTPLPDTAYDGDDHAELRFQTVSSQQDASISLSLVTRPLMKVVEPGQTVHMLTALWRIASTYTASPFNSAWAENMLLQYQTWPAA